MNEIQLELRKSLQKYCQEKIEPHMEHDDDASMFRKELFQGFGELGVAAVPLPEEVGGAGLGYMEYITALQTIAEYSVPYAVTLSVSTMVQTILSEYGNVDQRTKYLPPLTSGKEIGAFALSESHSGSDAAGLKTTAKKVDGGYELNGTKMWITSGGVASTYIVMARTSGDGAKGISAFIVEDGTQGFSIGKKENKMGWRTSPTCELIFEKCIVPEENLLLSEGEGFKVAMGGLDKGRLAIAAIGLGCAKRCLDESVRYALERQQFKQPIFEFQGLQFILAEMATDVESAQALIDKAAKFIDNKQPAQKLCSMAKMRATDTAMKTSTDAVQVFGGVGYTKEYPVERFMRDAKVLQIVEGTNQIQKVVISRQLKKEYQS